MLLRLVDIILQVCVSLTPYCCVLSWGLTLERESVFEEFQVDLVFSPS